jgi:hypothetical protein
LITDATSYGDEYQNQQQEPPHTIARVSTVDNRRIDYEEKPDLYFEESEETTESEVLKISFLSCCDYSRAPIEPYKEEPIEDSLQSVLTMPKGQERIKDNPRSEMRQLRQDNGRMGNISTPRQPWQNGKAHLIFHIVIMNTDILINHYYIQVCQEALKKLY